MGWNDHTEDAASFKKDRFSSGYGTMKNDSSFLVAIIFFYFQNKYFN
jgi:hypothetical protein